LAGIAADQFAAPTLDSSSPLWAAAVCLALVWRRDEVGFEREIRTSNSNFSADPAAEAWTFGFSFARISLFVGAHVLLVSAARFLHEALDAINGTFSFAGWITAVLKLSVLLPTLMLLPLKRCRILARAYAAEGIAALVVLFTFFPGRILASVWSWYGQVLGRLVFLLSGFFVHGLTYTNTLTPTGHGPDLDVTILRACSGISGIELFDYLFAFMALLDWNRLRKGRTLFAYFAGIVAMFAGNALRIASFVILGNRNLPMSLRAFTSPPAGSFFPLFFSRIFPGPTGAF
jgi:exosortase/archaeosortase family protein